MWVEGFLSGLVAVSKVPHLLGPLSSFGTAWPLPAPIRGLSTLPTLCNYGKTRLFVARPPCLSETPQLISFKRVPHTGLLDLLPPANEVCEGSRHSQVCVSQSFYAAWLASTCVAHTCFFFLYRSCHGAYVVAGGCVWLPWGKSGSTVEHT